MKQGLLIVTYWIKVEKLNACVDKLPFVWSSSQAQPSPFVRSSSQVAHMDEEDTDEEDIEGLTPETRCEPCFAFQRVGQEPFVIMTLGYCWVDEEGVVNEGPKDCICCRHCAGEVFLNPRRFNILNIRLYRRIQHASGTSHWCASPKTQFKEVYTKGVHHYCWTGIHDCIILNRW